MRRSAPDAILLSFGDELALGQTVDTNAPWLAQELAMRGWMAAEHRCIADDRTAIARAFTEAAARAPLVVASGGLGPTGDDLTRAALADALGEPLVEDTQALADIEALFAARGKVMPAANRIQARRPASARMLPNACGTAPGLSVRLAPPHGQAQIFVLPGVPHEMKAMFTASVAPHLPRPPAARACWALGAVHSVGLAESEINLRLRDLMGRDANPTVGTTVSGGLCSVRVRACAPSAQGAQTMLAGILDDIEKRLGSDFVFGRGDTTLPQAVITRLIAGQKTLATAESLTGGGLGAALTAVPGASAVYAGGFITYSNAMKAACLDVSEDLLRIHGPVSEPVILEMAEGALARTEAHFALATSGIAGPDGGTAEHPVGTVWIGLAIRGQATLARRFSFGGNREEVRRRSVSAALQMLLRQR